MACGVIEGEGTEKKEIYFERSLFDRHLSFFFK